MASIASLNVACGDGKICLVDPITPLYSNCGEIVIPIGTYPHHVEVNPTAITIYPTKPTPTTGYPGYPADPPSTTTYVHSEPNHSPPPYCRDPLLDIVINLLGLDIDVTAYLDLSGLLGAVGDLLSGLLGHGKGKGKNAPKSITRKYEAHCGATLEHCHHGTERRNETASDAEDCVQRCEKAGIVATIQLGSLVDCLGVTINHGISVDNCLFVLGDKHNVLNLDLDLLGGDSNTDSLINLKLT